MQELIELENGNGAVKLTTAYYYLPNGERIHGHGVAPHKVVDLTPEEKETLLESQLAVFSTASAPADDPQTRPAAATGTAPSGTSRSSSTPTAGSAERGARTSWPPCAD